MKKIFVCLLLFFALIFPVFAQINDIQKDEVNLNAIYPADSVETTDNITGEHIKSFDSKIIINKDGTIDVRETIVYDFDYLQKHGIYRDIDFIKTNQEGKKFELKFNDFSIKDENDRNYNYTTSTINEEYTRLKIGDADKLISGIHTYIISYKVSGALTYFSDHDELFWNINGNGWTVPSLELTSEVSTPPGIKKEEIKTVCYTGAYGSKESLCSNELLSQSDSTKIVTKANNSLLGGEGLSVVVSFPKNIVAVLEPKEFISFWDSWIGKLVSFILGILALIWYIGLPFFIIYRWLRYGRDPSTPGSTSLTTRSGQIQGIVSAWFDPPKIQDGKRFLTPGEVGTLGDETVDMKDISATIVDLARRGYLIIDERKKGDFWLIKTNMDSRSSSLSDEYLRVDDLRGNDTKPQKEGLLKYESIIIDKFFGGKDEIRIKDEKLASEVEQIKDEMYKQVVEDKLFDKNPQTTRTGYYVLAGVALFTGNFFLAIVAFLFGRVMPRKTVFGVEAKNVAFSLKNFLTSQQRQLEFQADKQLMFERLLPFAVAFGVERIWAKRFESLNITQPNWYRSYSHTNFSSYMLVNSLNSSFKSINTAATPTRSSSGFSSGSSGGFSGGGGGGGGGGSW